MTTTLLTPDEVAKRLPCSRKTLAGHVSRDDIRYVIIGHGSKRPRRMFTDADVEEFIERQTRRDVPLCQPIVRTIRRSAASISKGEAIGFMALRERRNAEKQRR